MATAQYGPVHSFYQNNHGVVIDARHPQVRSIYACAEFIGGRYLQVRGIYMNARYFWGPYVSTACFTPVRTQV